MKRKILSIAVALALCVGMMPVPVWAAGTTLTKPLDFTNVGNEEGKTPAEGPGYKLSGDSSSGYTLVLDGLSLNATEYDDEFYWGQVQVRAAIVLPNDGPVTVELRGTNTISASNQRNDEHAIATKAPFPVTLEGSGKLVTNVHNAVVASNGGDAAGNIIIKNVSIVENQKGEGLWCRSGSISIENANLTINAKGTNAAAIQAAKDVTITNSSVTVSCDEDHGICARENVTITGGTITAASYAAGGYAKIAAFGALSIGGGANVTTVGTSLFGLYAAGAMTLSQSEISPNGATAAVRFNGSLTLKGMAILEPSDGKIGTNAISNGDDTNAASAKLAPVTLYAPAGLLTCTYGDASIDVTLTTAPQAASAVEIYNGTAKVGEGSLGEAVTIDTSKFPAGDITLTAKLPNELGEKDFTVTVNKKPLTVTGATAAGRAYDGTNEVEITAVTLDGVVDGDDVSVDCSGLKGTISGADVGTYSTVTLPQTLTLTGAQAGNYILTQPAGAVAASVAISKGTYTGETTAETSGKFGVSKTFDFSSLLPAGAVLGQVSVASDDSIFTETPSVSNGILSYTLVSNAEKVGVSAVVTIPVTSSTNYEAFDLIITITVADKYVPTLTVSPITVTYTGEPVPDSAIKGTATMDGQTIPGTWSFVNAPTSVTDSGDVQVKFMPDDNYANDYAATEGTVTVTINKADPKGTPTYTAISESGKKLADAALTAPEGWPVGTLSWDEADTTEVTANTAYQWTFTPTDTDNYNTLTGSITLWKRSTGGGGGGGGTSQPTLPVTTGTTTEGGTPTTETTAVPTASTQNGTASATVSTAMGNEIVKQAVENNSETVVIAPKVTGDVSRTEVSIPASTVGQLGNQTGASLTVSTPVADVTIPNGGLGSLASAGGTVTVTAEQTGSTVELSVTAGGKAVENVPGGLTLTVPVESTAPGTVAVLVHEDGTREVVRKSVADSDSVTIPLEGPARLEIVDNSGLFTDVPATSWAADAVAFASAHELFSGTAPGRFSPGEAMTRGMMAVVLHNLESNPSQAVTDVFSDVDNSEWYAKGVAWAAANGIVAGYGNGQFGPGGNITREQLAVMLWRYAGSPAATDKELHFADAYRASDWALDALCWAVENGIVNGKGGGVLDPTGQATRAETAQMLKNFIERR